MLSGSGASMAADNVRPISGRAGAEPAPSRRRAGSRILKKHTRRLGPLHRRVLQQAGPPQPYNGRCRDSAPGTSRAPRLTRRNEATVALKTWAIGGFVCGSNPIRVRPAPGYTRLARRLARPGACAPGYFTRVYVITIDSNILPSLMLGAHQRIVNSSLLLISYWYL